MKKVILYLILCAGLIFAQEYTVTKVNGDVKHQPGGNETWITINKGDILDENSVVSTGKNSSVVLKSKNNVFTLNESSAVSISRIKKMSIDELLLALAMEDMMNTPKDNGSGKSTNTAVYGTDESNNDEINPASNEFGIKRLNGALQLAKNNMKESAVVVAKETFRKYPDTKQNSSYRILFADILYEKGLYNEAFEDFSEIVELKLNSEEKLSVDEKIEKIKKILLNK